MMVIFIFIIILNVLEYLLFKKESYLFIFLTCITLIIFGLSIFTMNMYLWTESNYLINTYYYGLFRFYLSNEPKDPIIKYSFDPTFIFAASLLFYSIIDLIVFIFKEKKKAKLKNAYTHN